MALRTPAFNDAKSYGFEWLRALLELDGQEGVVNAGDFKVTAAAGGGMKVDIAAGTALVKGDSGVPGTGLSQGLYLIVNDAAIANAVTLNASDGSNPRIDQIVLRARDSSDLGSGADDAVLEVVTGTPTAGATLDNRNGAAALPNDRVRLADVLVPAGSSSVSAGNVRDRRPWARGAYSKILRTAGDYTSVGAGAWATGGNVIDATNLSPRIECSGAPLSVRLTGVLSGTGTAQAFNAGTGVKVDGTIVDSLTKGPFQQYVPTTGQSVPFGVTYDFVPAAGSHVLAAVAGTDAGATALTLKAGTDIPLLMVVEELVRQNANNT